MMHGPRCTATNKDGTACRGVARTGSDYCWNHDPALAERRASWQRKGGEAKSKQARAAKQWAAAGREINQDDLPAMLRACIIDVYEGRLEASVASAIATLAKTAVALSNDLELTKRIDALEEAAGIAGQSTQLRRVK